MLYGTLVSMNPHSGEGFDKLSPNGVFFARWILFPLGLGSHPFGFNSHPFGLSSHPFGLSSHTSGLGSHPFGLSLSKPSHGPAQP